MDRFRTLTLLCGALAIGVVLVNAVLIILRSSGSLPAMELPEPASIGLFTVAILLLVASPAVKGAVFKRADAEGFDGNPNLRFGAIQTAFIVAFAMREAAGFLGFILALLTGNPWWSWGLGGAALIAMAVDWPNRQVLGWDQTPGPK